MFLYRLISVVVATFLFPILSPRVLCTPKYRSVVKERLGWTPLSFLRKKSTPYVWIHALSVGEVNSAIAFVKAYAASHPDIEVVFSATTQTGYATAKSALGKDVPVFLFPYDFSFSVMKRIREISPTRVILVETDIWPGFLIALHQAKIPVDLVNARLSDRSFKGYVKYKWFFKKIFSYFTAIMVQTEEDAKRFEQIGVLPQKIQVTGNMKYDAEIDPLSESEREIRRFALEIKENEILWVAGSTHPGEEELLLHAMNDFLKAGSARLVIVPRDPKRAVHIKKQCEENGYSAHLLSEGKNESVSVFVVDGFGQLIDLYGIADAAFVGGSLLSFGGHNPLEPAARQVPVLFGSDMSDFRFPARVLVAQKGAIEVSDETDLKQAIAFLSTHKETRQKMGKAARQVFLENKGALVKTLQRLSIELGYDDGTMAT